MLEARPQDDLLPARQTTSPGRTESTTKVNKTEELAKKSGGPRKAGFGFAKKQTVGAGS